MKYFALQLQNVFPRYFVCLIYFMKTGTGNSNKKFRVLGWIGCNECLSKGLYILNFVR